MAIKKLRARASAFLLGVLLSAGIGVALAGLETGTYISDLVATNPLSSDLASTADDHLRLIKSTVKTTFPNINGAVTATDEQLNQVTGTFTTAPVELENASWRLLFDETDATTNERLYDFAASAGQFLGRTRTDADAAGNSWLVVDRNGTTVTSIALASTAITWNANTLFTTANDGSGSGLDADLLDGSSSAAFAQIAASNTFTGTTQTISAASPTWRITETDAAADNAIWQIQGNSEQFRLHAVNDALNTTTAAIAIDRTGTTIDSIALTGTALTWGGNTLFTTANDGSGSGLDADLLDGNSSAEFAQLDVSNTFTGAVQNINETVPKWRLTENDQAADSGVWETIVNSGNWTVRTRNDADSAGAEAINIDRSGTSVTTVTVNGTSFSLTAPATISSGSAVATPTLEVNTTRPIVMWDESDGAADNQRWYFDANSEQFRGVAINDANNSSNNWVTVDRTGTTIDAVAFSGTALTWNTNTLFTTANDGSGSGLDADLLDGSSSAAFAQLSASNVFTGGTQEIENSSPRITWDESDAAANERIWRTSSSAGLFTFGTRSDADGAGNEAISIDRTGTTVDSINLTATSVQAHGVQIIGRDAATGTAVSRVVSTQFKGGNTDRSSTTTLADDPTLAGLTIPEAGTYIIDSQLCFLGPVSGAGGFKFRFEFTGTVGANPLGMYTGFVNGAVVGGGGSLFLDANQVSFATISTTGNCVRASHTLNASTTGTVSLQWAQNTSDANATRMSAGSAMWITRIG